MDEDKCNHWRVTSTTEKGPHCCDCGVLLAGVFNAVPRNTPLGAFIWAAKQDGASKESGNGQ
jgi:hypothetical protein